MELSRIESAKGLLDALRVKQGLPADATILIDRIFFKIQIIKALKIEGLEQIDDLAPYAGLWAGLIDCAGKLLRVIEQHVSATPGCLPQDNENCALLSDVLSLNENLLAGNFNFKEKINRGETADNTIKA